MATYRLRIYLVGDSPRSEVALANLRALCERCVPGDYELEVVEVLDSPELAAADRVVAMPTVVKLSPLPRRRVIGDLSDRAAAAAGLGLPEPPSTDEGAR